MSKANRQPKARSQRRKKTAGPIPVNEAKRSLPWFAIGGFVLVAAVASVWAFAISEQNEKPSPYSTKDGSASAVATVASSQPIAAALPPRHEITAEERRLSGKTKFGQFPPYTDAERELEKLLRGKNEDIDLALANWLIASDLPQFRDMSREEYFRLLDAMTDQVRQAMTVMQMTGSHGANPNDPDTRCYMFCSAIVGLQFAYREEFRSENITRAQEKALHGDANNTFLPGLLRTRRGSCVSMPLVYLVIGRRLGLPVHLVTVGKHYFIRWEEPGYRMNIEPTIVQKVCMTPDESVYLDTEGLTRDQIRGSDLQNLTNREVVGQLFFTRSCYWDTKGPKAENQRCLDLSRARYLSSDDPAIAALHKAVFDYYGIKPEHTAIDIRPTE